MCLSELSQTHWSSTEATAWALRTDLRVPSDSRKHWPNVSSLNVLTDYLGVKREYLWQMAGLLEDMDNNTENTFGDPQVRFYFARVDKLPEKKRQIVLSVIEALMVNLLAEDSSIQTEDTIVSET